jgi:hypothetical protein
MMLTETGSKDHIQWRDLILAVLNLPSLLLEILLVLNDVLYNLRASREILVKNVGLVYTRAA